MPDETRTPPPSTSFAKAKRIADWTAKGLLSAIVLVAGIVFGRQVLIWWRADDTPSIRLPSPNPLGDAERTHSIRFGDAAWSLARRSITGGREEAIAQLRAECRAMLQSMQPQPAEAPEAEEPVEPLPQPGGTIDGGDFMALLERIEPADREPGRWRLYEFTETFPMAVAVADSAGRLAQSHNWAIIWAIAVPAGDNLWSLCVFHPADAAAGEITGSIDAPLPLGGRRTLSIAAEGCGIVAFTGPDEPDAWKRSYDEWFTRRNWRQSTAWRKIGKAWYARYVSPDSVDYAVEVRFGPDAGGGLRGVLMITPPRSM